MNFQSGDLVIIISPPHSLPASQQIYRWLIGKSGTIVARHLDRVHSICGQYWLVTIPGIGLTEVAQLCLRKIDPDGRQVVDFDWRTLVTPETASA